jgi:hypothetical protein
MTSPIRLTDAELAMVLQAARPLAPHQRGAFLQAVAGELVRLGDQVGPGAVHRICAVVQRRFFDAPDLSGAA